MPHTIIKPRKATPLEVLSATNPFFSFSLSPLRVSTEFVTRPRDTIITHPFSFILGIPINFTKWERQKSQSSNLYADASLKPAFSLCVVIMEPLANGFPETNCVREMPPEKIMVKSGSGIRRVGLRAEIDTSPPFGSVKEAVTRFEGIGPWIPVGEANNSIEDFDLKKVEEQAAKLEKDLIVKELETLDVLEQLGATKTIVEELKHQLQTEGLKYFSTPDINHQQVGAPMKNHANIVNNNGQILQSPSPCTMPSPDMFFMELKQAKVNLGKTIHDLGVIQSSVETLNKKIKNERLFLQRTRENLASNFAAVSGQDLTKKEARLMPPTTPVGTNCAFHNHQNVARNFKFDDGQCNEMNKTRIPEVLQSLPENGESGFSIKTAEMRWLAAKKMEEAAMAAEAVAFAEINALSSGFTLPEHQKVTIPLESSSPLSHIVQTPQDSTLKNPINSKFQINEITTSKLTILKRLEEATEEVLRSKQVLTDALNSVETANRKQHAAEEALRRWIPEDDLKRQTLYNSITRDNFDQAGNCRDPPLPNITKSITLNKEPKPAFRSSVSMRDLLSKKQVPEECPTTKEMEECTGRNVALSQLLQALREEVNTPTTREKNESYQKHSIAERKKLGFIQISFPLGRRSKKRT